MLEKTNSKIFTTLLGFSALLVAAAAAIFSVTGLSMLYSGEMLYVAIAMGALEFAKIITASFLYRYWKTTGWGLKTYLSIAVLVLMLVTSGGIYGYLTNSYQGATIGLDKINSQAQVLDQRKQNLVDERERLKSDIATLRAERQSTIENRNSEIAANNTATDSNSVKYRAWRNSQAHKRYDEELTRIDDNISRYTEQLDTTNVRLSTVEQDISDKKLEMIDTGVDVGPLVYMARIFNTTMDNVMKWFTLVIVFVFDPLAIALIVAYNSVIMKGRQEKEYSVGIDPALPGDFSITSSFDPIPQEHIGLEVGEFGGYDIPQEDDEDDEIIFDKPGIESAKPIEESFDNIEKKIKEEKDFLQEVDDEIEEMENEVEVEKELKAGTELFKHFIESQEDLDEDFSEALEETTKKVGQDEPTKERIVQEPAKSGDIPKEKIIDAVEKVKHKNEFFDKMRTEPEKKDEEAFEKEIEEKKKSPVTNDEIRAYFEDAVRKVKKEGQGMIIRSPFQAGGSVNVGHMEDDPDVDYSVQSDPVNEK